MHYRTPTDRAEVLNRYFTSVFTHETTSGTNQLTNYLKSTESKQSIELPQCFAEEEVYRALCKTDVQNSGGQDGIPCHLFHEGSPWIAQPLSNSFQPLTQLGSPPADCRWSNITPIFKEGSKIHHPLINQLASHASQLRF